MPLLEGAHLRRPVVAVGEWVENRNVNNGPTDCRIQLLPVGNLDETM